jgi:solute carrier family 25 carnitine/acylcarnitine transporter 20/29
VPSPTAEPPPLSTAAQLGAGSFAAVAAWVVGYPADVLKTRCQMEGGPSSLAEAARIVHAKGGFPAFYRGLGLKLLRAVPQSAVSFLAYERFMELLAKRHEKRD